MTVLWKHKNAYILPNILLSEKIKLEIYEDGDKVFKKKFYTKVAFNINGKIDKLYMIRISQKKNAKLTKLVSLSI